MEIAVVGLAAEYPGASSPGELWENVLAGRRNFRRLPDVRLNSGDYLSADGNDPDRTYLTRAAVIEGYAFDRVKYRISKSTYEQTDLAHWLALDVASRALADAGLENGHGIPKERTGVVFGNSLTGEFSRANIMRLRWPYVRRVLDSVLQELGKDTAERERVVGMMHAAYKEPFPAPDADMLAGGLSNTIAGRITNYFDFSGGCMTVDGACSSSLLSVVEGCRLLVTNEWDVAIVGGVDLSIDPFEIIGFSRNGALARNDMRVFDARSEGFWPGEGCGVAVLVRKADAEKWGLSSHAIVRGWGMSSDGRGGLTRPKVETQSLAMRRCYEMAGYEIGRVAYFEGHGTGTPVGDEVELVALAAELGSSSRAENGFVPAVGSIKELIGHTKAAAGIAGFIKACSAVDRGILPPGRGTDTPHPLFAQHQKVLRRSQEADLWQGDRPMKASVSSMGFGGINVHVTLESKNGSQHRARAFNAKEQRLLASHRDAEILVLAATSAERLLDRLKELRGRVSELSIAELGDLSGSMCRQIGRGSHRLCFVSKDGPELAEQLDIAIERLAAGPAAIMDVYRGIFYGSGSPKKLGFIFPGQGAPSCPHAGAARALLDRSPAERPHLDRDVANAGNTADTAQAQPAILASSLAGLRLLKRFNVQADVAIGHSLGEIAALAWAGAIDEGDVIALGTARGRAMAEYGRANGGMLALYCTKDQAAALLEGTDCVISCENGPANVVAGGDRGDLAIVQQRAESEAIRCVPLRVSHAFHSSHMESALPPFREVLGRCVLRPVVGNVISTISGRSLGPADDLRALLASQLIKPVLFQSAIDLAAGVDLWIEVGPGDTLSRALRWTPTPVVSIDIGSATIGGCLKALGGAFALGHLVDFEALAEARFVREIDLKRARSFFESPCEKVGKSDLLLEESAPVKPASSLAVEKRTAETIGLDRTRQGVQDALRHFVSAAAEIPSDSVRSSDRLLSDLHLNSLTVLDLVSKVGKAFALGNREYARAAMKVHTDSTLVELADFLFDAVSGSGGPKEQTSEKTELALDDLPAWVHVFAPGLEPVRTRKPVTSLDADNAWRAFGAPDDVVAAVLKELAEDDLRIGNAIALVTNATISAEGVSEFLRAAEALRKGNFDHFLLVELESSRASNSLAPAVRTLAIEHPASRYTVVRLPEGWFGGAARAVKTEASLSRGYHEVELDGRGGRFRPAMRPVFIEGDGPKPRLGTSDVVVVTGGGKGITFECARHLAMATGAGLGLIGRSSPEKDPVLKANLAKLSVENVRWHYAAADVVSSDLTAAVQQIERNLGTISALIHGAGTNEPAGIPHQSVEKWERTRAPKIVGLVNMLKALAGRPLKALITFGSIIARTGMHGELDYALSNEELGRFTEQYAALHPEALVVCLEWSVWSGTGMGEDLKTIERLKSAGVSPITVEQGLGVLMRVIETSQRLAARLTVTSRYGSLPTMLIGQASPVQRARFTEKTLMHTPEVELVSEALLTPISDPYLKDHVYRGQMVFPTVMAFEAMAQHATALVPGFQTITIRNARFQRPILVPKDGATRIRIALSRQGEKRFSASIRASDSGFTVDCFGAEVLLDQPGDAAAVDSAASTENHVPMDVGAQLYDRVLFHTGEFRRITGFNAIHRNETTAELDVPVIQPWFGPNLPQRLVLGCPGLNDAAIHAHQASVPQFSLLPSSVDRVTFARPHALGRMRLRTVERSIGPEHVIVDSHIFDLEGRLVQSWEGMTLRRVKGSDFDGPWPLALLGAYLEHTARNIFADQAFRCSIESNDRTGQVEIRHHAGKTSSTIVPISRDIFSAQANGTTSVKEMLQQLNGRVFTGPLARLSMPGYSAGAYPGKPVAAAESGWQLSLLGGGEAEKQIATRSFELDTGACILCVLAAS